MTQEQTTVNQIRTALSGLGKTTTCAGDLLQQGTLSADQAQAVITLMALAGATPQTALSQYDNGERAGYSAGAHNTQACKIEDLLKKIEETITAEKKTAEDNFTNDSADILKDKTDAYAAAEAIYTALETKHTKLVGDAAADKNTKCDDLLPKALQAKNTAVAEYDTANSNHESAKSTRTSEIATATTTRDNALTEADGFYTERDTAITTDHDAEIARLDATIAECDQITKLVDKMSFTASALLQAKAQGVADNSYRTANSADEKTSILELVDSLIAQVVTERARAAKEYLDDNSANQAEKSRADSEAASVATNDLQSLQRAVDEARTAKTAAEPELTAATQAHDDASKVHNANMDTRATAQKIQAVNTPNFQTDLDATKKVAGEILAKQQELHVKCELSKKYITITKDYVTLIQTAASSVSSNALSTTVNTAVSVTDSYTAAGTAAMIASAHTKLKEQLSKETKAERERCRLQGVDNPGCHADETGTTAWDHKTHVNVANHADTNAMGQNQQYDANGEPVASSRRLLSAQTLGSVITDILTQVTAEETRIKTECDAQEAAFNSQHVDTGPEFTCGFVS